VVVWGANIYFSLSFTYLFFFLMILVPFKPSYSLTIIIFQIKYFCIFLSKILFVKNNHIPSQIRIVVSIRV